MSRFDFLEFDDKDKAPEPKPDVEEPVFPSREKAPMEKAPAPKPQFPEVTPAKTPSAKAPAQSATGTPIRDAAYFVKEGDIQFHLDNLEPALRNYSRALEQESTLFEGWLGQVRVLLETGEYKEADLWATKALELFPEQADLLAVKAIASMRMGKSSMALAQSDHALSSKGATAFVWLARAEVLLATRKPMSDHCISKAMELNSNGWVFWEISRLLRRYKSATKAAKYARDATRLLPSESGAWLELARCHVELKNPDAKQALEQAVTLDSNCVNAEKLLKNYREPGILNKLMFWKK